MKKLFIILFFLTMTVGTTTGQPYKSIFGQTQTSWNVAYISDDYILTDSLVIGIDTMIWGTNYKIIHNYSSGWHFNGYVREDTNTGRVWYLDHSMNYNEFLVMDLSLNIGDSFCIYTMFSEGNAVVDSIKYIGGNKCLILSCDPFISPVLSWGEELKFTEGIGPNAGIIFQINKATDFWGGYSYLLCAYKDNVQIYTNSSIDFYGQCYVHYGGIEKNQYENSKLSVYPNPSSDKLQIYYKGVQPYAIEIFDYTGKLVLSQTNINSSLFDIDMADDPHGIYLLKAKGNNGKYAIGRILKL